MAQLASRSAFVVTSRTSFTQKAPSINHHRTPMSPSNGRFVRGVFAGNSIRELTATKLAMIKAPESTSSCGVCRHKHLKCDRAFPVCGRCQLAGHDCRYRCGDVRSQSAKVACAQPQTPTASVSVPASAGQSLEVSDLATSLVNTHGSLSSGS